VPRVTYKETVVPNIVLAPKDVTVDHIVPHDVPIDIPRIVTTTQDRPRTANESHFAAKPEYQDAPYHGRIIASVGGGALSFADGKSFYPAHWDASTSQSTLDPNRAFAAEEFIGDLAFCQEDAVTKLWTCAALHDGRETPIVYKQGRAT